MPTASFYLLGAQADHIWIHFYPGSYYGSYYEPKISHIPSKLPFRNTLTFMLRGIPWWHTAETTAHGRLRQKDGGFKASQSGIKGCSPDSYETPFETNKPMMSYGLVALVNSYPCLLNSESLLAGHQSAWNFPEGRISSFFLRREQERMPASSLR